MATPLWGTLETRTLNSSKSTGNKLRKKARHSSSLNQLYHQGFYNGEPRLANSSTGQSCLRKRLTKSPQPCNGVHFCADCPQQIIALHCLLPESASHSLSPTAATPALFREGTRPAGPLSTCHISPCTCPFPLCSQIFSLSGPTIIWGFANRNFLIIYQQP